MKLLFWRVLHIKPYLIDASLQITIPPKQHHQVSPEIT